MPRQTAFQVGDEVVFLGGSLMRAEAGALAIVTRSPYRKGCLLVDVVWKDRNRSKGQHDGGYEACLFVRPATILTFQRRCIQLELPLGT